MDLLGTHFYQEHLAFEVQEHTTYPIGSTTALFNMRNMFYYELSTTQDTLEKIELTVPKAHVSTTS